MRTKKSSKSNMRFLKGNVLFFAVLLLVMLLFTYYAVTEMDYKTENQSSCKISFSDGFEGGECQVFVGDSLLYSGAPLKSDSVLVMRRYANGDNEKSLYTSESQIKVVTADATVARTLEGDRAFVIGSRNGQVVVDVVEEWDK